MNILCVGDIVGSEGTDFFISKIQNLKREYNVDFVVCNAENADKKNGLSRNVADKILLGGADVITLGNHAFRQLAFSESLEESTNIIRPLNFHKSAYGNGFLTFYCKNKKIGVANLLGNINMDNCGSINNPYDAIDEIIKSHTCDILIVDFHAETTSEKRAMGFYLDGKASIVFGTHTHVQTSDEQILAQNTAYITDVGMCGVIDSVLGVKKELIIKKLRTNYPVSFEFASGNCQMGCILVNIDDKTNKATTIKRLNIR